MVLQEKAPNEESMGCIGFRSVPGSAFRERGVRTQFVVTSLNLKIL